MPGWGAERVRRLPLLTLAFVALGGCLAPAQYCEQVNATTCRRVFECASGPALDALRATYPDEAACRATFDERLRCATQTEQAFCAGKRWNAQKALACLEELDQLSCEGLATYRPACAPPCE